MSSAILGAIAKIVVSEIWNKIKGHLFKPDTSVVDTIVGGFAQLERLIKELDYLNKLHGPMVQIYYWTDRMKTVVGDLQKDNSPENIAAYNRVIDALSSESNGIRFQTYSLYSTVMSIQTPVTNQGLLKYWADEAYKKLADEGNTKYFMQDYIDELDANIAAVAALLHHGLNLTLFIAQTTSHAEDYRKECKDRVEIFRKTLFETHYPPALRQFKPTYDDKGSFLTSKWFHLHEEQDTTGKKFLSILNYWIRQLTLAGPGGDSAAKLRGFRFVGPKTPLGPLELHAYWLAGKDNNSRVRFYNDVPAGSKRIYAYTNSTSGATYIIRFKLIPLAVSSGGNSRKPVKLIPFREDTLVRTTADDKNTFGNVWRLAVTTNPE